jgi:hypothetical protein
MAHRLTEMMNLVKGVLDEAGVDYTIVHGRHPKAVLRWEGRTKSFAFAGSPSDRRSFVNTRCALNRVVRELKGSGALLQGGSARCS